MECLPSFCVPSGFMAGLFVNRVYGEAYWYLTAVEATGFAGMLAGSSFHEYTRQHGRTENVYIAAYSCSALLV